MKVGHLTLKSESHKTTLLAYIGCMIVTIFICDTLTSYEVTVSAFYIIVIIIAAYILKLRRLVLITAACVCLILLSFNLTRKGDYFAGFINMAISIISIITIYYLLQKIEAARIAAHEAQTRLLRIARVNSLENLTISITHEINQPLAAIVTSSSACKRWLSQETANLDKALQTLERIQADACRASEIIDRLHNFSKGKPPQKTVFALNEAAQEVVTLSQGEIARHGITLKVNFTPEDSFVLADRIQIQQVISNLISNSIDATALMPVCKREIQITSMCRNHKIIFCIFDTGIGLSAETQAHLFEAFWTTKEKGMGIGLSISRTIIEASGGHIWAQPNENAGTVFRFCLPAIYR